MSDEYFNSRYFDDLYRKMVYGTTNLKQPYWVSLDPGAPSRPSLSATVELELAAIMADMTDFDTAPPELPPPPPELADTYAVAYEQAVRKCTHSRSSRSTMYARNEHQCDDCGRYFTKPRGLFG